MERVDLLGAGGKAVRTKIDIEGGETMGTILGLKGYALSIASKAVGEGDLLVVIEVAYGR